MEYKPKNDVQPDGSSAPAGEATFRQLSESLYALEDTCNVYLVRDGDAGLLIDSGSGQVTTALSELGVNSIDWILHTHHHRDQCWGTPDVVAQTGAKVAVPEHESYLFTHAEEHWSTKRIFDNYADGSTFFGPGTSIPVDAALVDYETFQWRDITFHIIPAQGHTFGSVALLAEIDQQLVAFTGDLLMAGGYVYQLHGLENDLGDMSGVSLTLQSLQALRRWSPRLVLPSHGPPSTEVGRDLDSLEERLMDFVRLGNNVWVGGRVAPDIAADRYLPEQRLIPLSEHLLWSGPWTCSNFYVLLSGSGEALFVDYGHAMWSNMRIGFDMQPYETMRFVVHHLDELKERFGVTSIEVVVATHIHDDHVCGIPYLQRHHGTDCWALDRVAQVLESPEEWASNPGLLPKPINVARTLGDGESIRWRDFDLKFHFAPGQTEFHSVISCEIDGRLVAFTGDNYFLGEVEVAGHIEKRPYQSTLFRGSFQLAMHRRCVEVMQSISPDLICPGHRDVYSCNSNALAEYAAYVAKKERVFRNAVLEPADHHIDMFWARLRPYLTSLDENRKMDYILMLRNNLGRPAKFEGRLLPPPGWEATSGFQMLALQPGESGEVALQLVAPAELGSSARVLVTAEILIDGVSQGPIAEALVVGGCTTMPGVSGPNGH